MAAFELLFWFLLVVTVDEITACTKINNCECRKSNGKIMSLKAVDSGTSEPRFTGIKGTKEGQPRSYTFSWNPCTTFSDGSCKNDLLCQKDGKLTYPIADTASSFTENDDGSITLTYKGITSDKGHSRIGIFQLVCDRSQNPGKPDTFNEVPVPGSTTASQYTTTFRSKFVCDEGCSGGSSSGLSTGSVLLIVFFLVLLLYIAAGLLYKRYHKGVESFPEMIPNHSFWSDFPFLIKDGCTFTFQGVSACCRSLYVKMKGDSYAAI